MCSLSPHVLRGEGSRILSFGGKVFEALSRGSGGMFLNKNLGFRCSETASESIVVELKSQIFLERMPPDPLTSYSFH